MELSDLQVFRAVVEEDGVTAAARRLHRVPSNVTARIKKLEEELGLALFSRDRNRLQLTPSGQRLLRYADQMLKLRERALEDLAGGEPCGQLSIGSMESSAAVRLPDVLVAFHERHPQVDLELATGASGALARRVLDGELDAAFVADPPRDERLCSTPLFAEQLVVVKPPSFPDTQGPASLPDPLTVVGFTESCSYRHRIEEWLAQGERRADRIIEIPSYHTMLSCVLAGIGIALVPEAVLRLHPAHQRAQLERPPRLIADATTVLLWRKNSETPAIQALAAVAGEFSNLPVSVAKR